MSGNRANQPALTGPAITDAESEPLITSMVARFYAIALQDNLLGPMFRAEITDMDEHLIIVANFWSHVLLGTDRYKRGTPYTHHTHLEVTEDHFTRWMGAFAQAVEETLPPRLAVPAMRRAEHMTQSFRMGLLPLPAPRTQA